jgi:hypothetical protein
MASSILLPPIGLAPGVSAGSGPNRQPRSRFAVHGLAEPHLRPDRAPGWVSLASGAAVSVAADRSGCERLKADPRSVDGSARTALWLRPLSSGGWRGLPQLLPLVLLVVSAFFWAPEAPQDQAAICQRHNGEAACRVW